MNRARSPAKLPSLPCEVEDYYSNDSSSPSLKQTFRSEAEVESSKTVVMPVMTIGINNLEEEMVGIKAMLERLVKDSEQKEVCIKSQEEKIAGLTRELKKRPTQSLAKSSECKEEERASVQK